MLKKALIIWVSGLAVVLAGNAFAAGKGAETMVLKGGSMGNVEFPHQEHQQKLKNCEACHKLFPQEAGAIQELIGAGTLQKKQVMNVCVSCHKETAAKGKESGPTSCKDCHNK